MFYGAVVWDPWLIVAQIVCVQCLYYLTLGVFMSLFVGTRVSRMSLVYFFDYVTVTASTVTGWCVIASFLLSAASGAVYMLYLIERAKKCLDFSATIYIIHLFICILYGGWPSSVTWWILNGTGIAVMALLGEYLCIKREMREIPITRFRANNGKASEVDWQRSHELPDMTSKILKEPKDTDPGARDDMAEKGGHFGHNLLPKSLQNNFKTRDDSHVFEGLPDIISLDFEDITDCIQSSEEEHSGQKSSLESLESVLKHEVCDDKPVCL